MKPSASRDNSTNASDFIPTRLDSFSASLIRIGVSRIKKLEEIWTALTHAGKMLLSRSAA